MSTSEQEKAFDNLTEVILEKAKERMLAKCSCCDETAYSFLKIWMCDTHMKKYSDIIDRNE